MQHNPILISMEIRMQKYKRQRFLLAQERFKNVDIYTGGSLLWSCRIKDRKQERLQENEEKDSRGKYTFESKAWFIRHSAIVLN